MKTWMSEYLSNRLGACSIARNSKIQCEIGGTLRIDGFCAVNPFSSMLLSISWASKLKETLQMDMSTISVFDQERRLYREVLLKYMVSSKNHPNNHPIYSVDIEIDSSIFYNDLSFEGEESTIVMNVEDKVAR
jgi:hypothetical protein